MSLSSSEQLLVLMKAYQLIGKTSVSRRNLVNLFIVFSDILDSEKLQVDTISPNYIWVPYLEGVINLLIKLKIINNEDGHLTLTDRGETLLTEVLSSKMNVSLLEMATELCKMDEKKLQLYAIFIAFKSREELIDDNLYRVGDSYLKFKKEMRALLQKLMKKSTPVIH